MAGGAGRHVSGLERAAARILFWRGTEKIFGAGGFADCNGAAFRISDQLFREAGEFVPAGSNGKRKRVQVDCHCRLAGGARGSREDLSTFDGRLRAVTEGFGGILSNVSGKNRKRGTARCTNPAGVRLG